MSHEGAVIPWGAAPEQGMALVVAAAAAAATLPPMFASGKAEPGKAWGCAATRHTRDHRRRPPAAAAAAAAERAPSTHQRRQTPSRPAEGPRTGRRCAWWGHAGGVRALFGRSHVGAGRVSARLPQQLWKGMKCELQAGSAGRAMRAAHASPRQLAASWRRPRWQKACSCRGCCFHCYHSSWPYLRQPRLRDDL